MNVIRLRIRFCFLAAMLVGGLGASVIVAEEGARHFENFIIDERAPRSPWGMTVGDIDGDGRQDLVVGGHAKPKRSLAERLLTRLGLQEANDAVGELVWYENPGWRKRVISNEFRIRTDLAVGDIDGDGLNDLVVLADQGVFWLKNPTWQAYEVVQSKVSPKFHDVEVADLDRDGDLDLVLRNQSLFGYEDGNRVYILIQESGSTWQEVILNIEHGEGLKIGDLNADGFDDVVVNGMWLKNPGGHIADHDWEQIDYTADWDWSDVYIDIHDVNSDGALDILLSPAEPTGSSYRLSWFEAVPDDEASWIEHVVEDRIESVHHFIGAGDFDGDGHTDIFSAEMNQGSDPDDVKVYMNQGDNVTWKKVVLGRFGSHSMQVADFDRDWDDELVGANWEFDDYDKDYPLTMWDFARPEPFGWQRHVIGNNGPWRNLFVYVADLDGDRLVDIVAGRSWFKNPGSINGRWSRHEFGKELRTAYLLHDFDGDGHIDVFGSAWDSLLTEPDLALRAKAKLSGEGYPGSGDGGKFLWARNDGRGNFRLYKNIEAGGGDFLQGITTFVDADKESVLLSWHKPGAGIQQIQIPDRPMSGIWSIHTVTDYSQDEQLSARDINYDGSADIVTGTTWIEPARNWTINSFHNQGDPPDRHVIVDIDSDGMLDVLVGFEAISKRGKLAWYSAVASESTLGPMENVIDFPIGPMSLSAKDMDGDGDIDVVVGEHDLRVPWDARLLLYENLGGQGMQWRKHIIWRGDEHHCGALPIDLDRDGDDDIVSIGWDHSNVIVYENLRREPGNMGLRQ